MCAPTSFSRHLSRAFYTLSLPFSLSLSLSVSLVNLIEHFYYFLRQYLPSSHNIIIKTNLRSPFRVNMSLRDLYYSNKYLFPGGQGEVDRAVSRLCKVLNTTRDCISVHASPRGNSPIVSLHCLLFFLSLSSSIFIITSFPSPSPSPSLSLSLSLSLSPVIV